MCDGERRVSDRWSINITWINKLMQFLKELFKNYSNTRGNVLLLFFFFFFLLKVSLWILFFMCTYSCKIMSLLALFWASQVVLVVKNLPDSAGEISYIWFDPWSGKSGHIRDAVLIPGLGRSPEGGHGNSSQYSCLENPMDREAWQATIHRVGHN